MYTAGSCTTMLIDISRETGPVIEFGVVYTVLKRRAKCQVYRSVRFRDIVSTDRNENFLAPRHKYKPREFLLDFSSIRVVRASSNSFCEYNSLIARGKIIAPHTRARRNPN
ncbi:hypothetical protein J6590_060691 [Homalodisca vitripennis]|nr:hypothetical protein J6590_060691 [Homalodisca vitripennis]